MSTSMRLEPGAVRLRRGITYRSFVSETVLLDAASGTYFGLDPEGGRMLEALVTLPTFEAAASALVSEGFGRFQDVVRDLHAVEGLLAQYGFLEAGTGPTAARFARGEAA